ncbi:sensor protein LytS [Massilia sp. Root418]|uniref:sensor histidine kinase n=1 Tax=Massilia sp. Root418 TaxID=1736532 RepID=UPI0006F7BC2D|nr:histidine kinase [Massilia sp. Root418]KQW88383.1 sensor protein LytS [Massilia sp. Root418]
MDHTAHPWIARLRWYWILQLAGWLCILLFVLATYSWALHMKGVALTTAWSAGTGLLLSHAWRWLFKRQGWHAPRIRWQMFAVPALVLSPLQAASVTLGIKLIQNSWPGTYGYLPMALIFWALVFVSWTVFYLMVKAIGRAARFEAETLRLEVSAKDAELRALQAQVNPHFFFNSLNSVRGLMYEDRDAAAQMIDQLASLMRYALQSGQSDTVPLAAELEAVQAYLAIEQIRFEERLRASLHVEAGVETVRVPPMSLQTLVENAVKYGVESSVTGSDITITARREAGCVRIEIANTGALRQFSNSTQVGLNNARKRLSLAVGRGASLELAETGGWVRATLTLPEAA